MDDVGLLELTQLRDIGTTVGYIHLKQVVALEMQMEENDQTFPQEMPPLAQRALKSNDADIVSRLVAYQHLGFHAMIIQSIHQTVGSNRCPTRLFTCIYYQYFHTACKVTKSREQNKRIYSFFAETE